MTKISHELAPCRGRRSYYLTHGTWRDMRAGCWEIAPELKNTARNGLSLQRPVRTHSCDTGRLEAGNLCSPVRRLALIPAPGAVREVVHLFARRGTNPWLKLGIVVSLLWLGCSPMLQSWAQSAIPSSLGWFQIPNTNISPLCPPYPEIQAVQGCSSVMADWSGGLFDTRRNRLIIDGGGHNAYFGNEIYAIDLNANPIVPVLVHDATHGASLTAPGSCSEANADGTPDSRHTYSGLVYISSIDKYLMYSGSKANCGFFSSGMWEYDPQTNTWSQISQNGSSQPNPGGNGSTPLLAYDPVTDAVYFNEVNAANFWKFDVKTNTWTKLNSWGTSACATLNTSADIDQSRRNFVCIGTGTLWKISLTAPYGRTQLAGANCSGILNAPGGSPGWAYDTTTNNFVGWGGGNTVYIYDPTTDSCTTQIYSGGPTTIQSLGTYGRFRYSPALNIFVVANDINSNAYTLRLTTGSGITLPPDTTPPTVSIIFPTNGTGISGSITVSGTAADNVAVSQVQVSIDSGALASASGTSNWTFSLNTATLSNGSHTITAKATDSSNNSATSSVVTITVSNTPADTTPPSIPTRLIASAGSSGQINLSWTASTDNVGVTGYNIYRCQGLTCTPSTQIGSVTGTSYSDSGLTASTTFTYAVSAFDAAGNNSAQSASAGAVTLPTSGGGGVSPDADFTARCGAPGVIACEGFDNASEFVPATSGNTGLFSNSGASHIVIVQDTAIYSSGGGSLHFPIHANDGQGISVRDNNWVQGFCGAHPPAGCTPIVISQNSTFYVQFRYRVDDGYANTNWELASNGGSSPKIADFAWTAPVGGSSCGQTELTTNNRLGSDMPMMYSACGATLVGTNPGTTNWNNSNPPYQWQNGYYNCSYPFAPSGPGGCFKMPANTWMTFYYKIQLGTWGQPNHHIQVWVGPDGQPLQSLIDVSNIVLNADEPGFNAIYFNVYMTGFNGAATNPAANAWLDEVIVSSQPIAAPAINSGAGGGGTGDTTPPAIAIASPTNGATVSGTISVTGTAVDNVAVSNVGVSVDGGAFSPASGTSNWTFSLNTITLTNASHTISAKATDTSGNVSSVTSVTVNINNAGATTTTTTTTTTTLTASTTTTTLPDTTPSLRKVDIYPNPAVKQDPTIRVFMGQVSSVEVTIFNVSGRVVHSTTLRGTPSGISNGQYYYDYTWTGSKASGIYFAVIHGKASDGSIIRARTKFAVVM